MPQAYLEKLKVNEKQNLPVEMENLVEGQRKNEYGYCNCGCGRKTPLAKRTRKYLGLTIGKPIKFLLGHNAKKRRKIS